jgi:hypothetical protein
VRRFGFGNGTDDAAAKVDAADTWAAGEEITYAADVGAQRALDVGDAEQALRDSRTAEHDEVLVDADL